ncbi:GDSL-type esterase/lipase family protein [Pontixanthobacter sp.]|uniref:GDSL-type esterase/lipase family protein n=1 Tax=Pontixanthobacter sp. TaxID=2792078 RepID=UPI003C7EC50C
MMRALLWTLGAAYLIALHAVAALALFAPHMLPYQGWRLGLPPAEPTAYVAERHRYIEWLDRHAEAGAVALVGASHLEAMDGSLLGRPVLKYAAGGDSLRQTGQRIMTYPNLDKASAIILWAGFNDTAHRKPPEIIADLPMVLGRLPANVPVITLALAPTSVAQKKTDIAAINTGYARQCAAVPRCIFVDTARALAGPDGGLARKYDRGDGIHLNQAGYRALAQLIKPVLPPVEG